MPTCGSYFAARQVVFPLPCPHHTTKTLHPAGSSGGPGVAALLAPLGSLLASISIGAAGGYLLSLVLEHQVSGHLFRFRSAAAAV